MKKYLLIIAIATSSTAHAGIDIGDVINAAKKIKVNCNATYIVSTSGVFGGSSKTEILNIKAKNSGEACVKAQSRASKGSGVFGPNSRVLSALQCTNVLGLSQFIDVNTCQPL